MGDAAGIGPEIIVRAFAEGRAQTLRRGGRRRRDAARLRAAGPPRGGRTHRRAAGSGRGAAGLPRRWSSPPGCRRAWPAAVGPGRRAPPAHAAARCIEHAVRLVQAGEVCGARHRADPQGGAGRRRRCPIRATPRCCRRWPPWTARTAAGAHDAGQRRAARRAGDDPPVAAARHRRRHFRRRAADAAHRARCGGCVGAGARRASPWPGSTRTPARAACSATRS